MEKFTLWGTGLLICQGTDIVISLFIGKQNGRLAGFKVGTHKLAKCGLNLKNASKKKIKHSNFFASPIF